MIYPVTGLLKRALKVDPAHLPSKEVWKELLPLVPSPEIAALQSRLIEEPDRREFEEEIGFRPEGPFISLGSVRQKAGKEIHAWASAGDVDPAQSTSNRISIEWPPGSGRMVEFPEVDCCQWFDPEEARTRLNPAQVAFIERLEAALRE